MKHPVWDRLLLLLCALLSLVGAAFVVLVLFDRISITNIQNVLAAIDMSRTVVKAIMVATAFAMTLLCVLLISAMLPNRRKRSSTFAIQRNENGMVRISLKAVEALVQKCLSQHAELKVVTSSLFSDEETIQVDVHISLQSDISMPLAISALQKQIKRYIEACSGVQVSEVRVFVDSTIPTPKNSPASPYAIPDSLLGNGGHDELPEGQADEEPGELDPKSREAMRAAEAKAEETVKAARKAAKDALLEAEEKANESLRSAETRASEILTAAQESIKAAAEEQANEIRNAAHKSAEAMKAAADERAVEIRNAAEEKADALKTAANERIAEVRNAAQSVVEETKEEAAAAIEEKTEEVKEAVEG